MGAGLLGAALIGCTGEDATSTPDPGVPGSRLRVRALLPATTPAPTTSVLRLGTLASEIGTDGLDSLSRAVTYSRLVGLDPRSATIYGDLAESIEIPEPLTVRFALREGVFFHPDGGGQALPLTAYEIVREMERRRDDGVFVFKDVIESAEASNDTTLTLRLLAPFSLLFEFLARGDASIRGDGQYSAVPARLGSGPLLPSFRDGDELVFVRNPLIGGPAAARLSQLRMLTAAQDADLDAAFSHGLLDVRHHPDEASRQRAASVPGRVEVQRPRFRQRGLALSLLPPRDQASQATVEAFRDVRVRRALSLAVDRKALAAADGSSLTGPVGPSFGGDALPIVELESHPLYQHNAEGALALLRAAGHEGVSVRISHADTPAMLSLAQLLVDQLTASGFIARLVSRPQAEFQQGFLSGDFEAAFFELDQLTTPDIGLRLHTSGGLEGVRSPWGYSNPVYDAAVRAALSEIDPVLRTRKSREAQRMLLNDVPAMFPLSVPTAYASLAAGVTGYEFDAYDFNASRLAAQWEGPPVADPTG